MVITTLAFYLVTIISLHILVPMNQFVECNFLINFPDFAIMILLRSPSLYILFN